MKVNRRLRQLSFVLFAIITLPLVSRAETCSSQVFSSRRVHYCIFETDRSKNADIIFQFHGLGGSQYVYNIYPPFIHLRHYWRNMGHPAPTVITLSMGPYWLLTHVQERGDLYDLFHDQVLPYLEQKVGGLRGGSRLLLGESMGGYNALQLYLNAPGDFKKVALMCPAISRLTPESTLTDLKEYQHRTGALTIFSQIMFHLAKHEFRNNQEWALDDPLELVKKPTPLAPPLYISSGYYDEYGFFEGDSLFAHAAMAAGRPVEWLPLPHGHHCSMDIPSLAKFLL